MLVSGLEFGSRSWIQPGQVLRVGSGLSFRPMQNSSLHMTINMMHRVGMDIPAFVCTLFAF